MPLYHLVGAVDPIEESDIEKRLNDGLPETLPEWIRANGLTHIKIKLNGSDLAWDVARVVRVDRVATATQAARGAKDWVYSLDFNERAPNVQYLLDFLAQIKKQTPAGFERVQYIEQPTARDLKANRANVMHEAAKQKPVVIDESLSDYESLLLAREMGYSGAALKACKGQTQALIMGAAVQHHKLFLCVQDLTCPGASLIHSAGLCGAREDRRRDRGELAPVRARGEREVGQALSGPVRHQGRHRRHVEADRAWPQPAGWSADVRLRRCFRAQRSASLNATPLYPVSSAYPRPRAPFVPVTSTAPSQYVTFVDRGVCSS